MTPLDRSPSLVTEPEARGRAIGSGAVLAGRYVVGDQLGEGGMAWVYLTYDIKLQRSVALKVLKSRADKAAETRIVREAQAMAQLGHPNVLPVFDVGSDDGRSFIVMEYVAGMTLRVWLAHAPRSRREILNVFIGAARGLQAAHAAGFVHRDFKQSNVLVDASGRARVMDFGLARNESSPSSSGSRTIGGVTMSLGDIDRLTITGTVMGTPAYMSPEQHRGETLDGRADQFAFCVGLYEALAGELPFVGDSLTELLRRKAAGTGTLAGLGRLPKPIAAMLTRGLAAEPTDRYASMSEIIDVLERASTPRRAPWGAIVGTTAVASAAIAATLLAPRATTCDGDADPIAGVWDDARRTQLVGALGAVDVAFAAATADATAQRLDRWRSTWLASYRDACEATHVRHDQSAARMDLRMGCLAGKKAEAGALVRVLLDRPDAGTLQRAVDAVAALESPASCDALVLAETPTDAPADAEHVAAILVDVRALDLAGRYEQAGRLADDAVAAATRLDHAPSSAQAHLLRSRVRRDAGAHTEALADLERAAALAVIGRDDAAARAVAIDAIELHADYLQSGEQARHLVAVAQAWVERTDAPLPERARLALASAAAELGAGDSAAAEVLARAAVEEIDRDFGTDHPMADKARNVLAIALANQGRHDEARTWWSAVRDLRVERLGAAHPHVAQADNNLASAFIDQGDYTGARPLAERAVAVATAALGPEHPEVASYLVNLALVHEGTGDDAGAARDLRRALAIQEKTLGREHAAVGRTLLNLGAIEIRTDGASAAAVTFERAHAVLGAALGESHPHVEVAEASLGQALHEAGRLVEARERLERAARKAEARSGPDDASVLALRMALLGLAVESGRAEDATQQLDDLLARMTSTRAMTLVHARPRLETAKLVWAYFPARRDEAVALGRSAVALYEAHADSGDVFAAEAKQWVAER